MSKLCSSLTSLGQNGAVHYIFKLESKELILVKNIAPSEYINMVDELTSQVNRPISSVGSSAGRA